MLRTFLLGLFAAAVFVVAFLFYQKMQPPTETEKQAEWRRFAVEPENAARPAEYHDFMYKESDSALRTPASTK